MAVSVANYQSEQSVPKLNSLGYDDESVSLAKCLPSHPQKPSRLPIFETAVTQQNGVGNFQCNAPQGHVRSSANMGSHHHSMNCGDFSSNLQQQSPLQNRNGYNQSFSQGRSEKIRKRASSFNEDLGKNKPLQPSKNFNSQKVDKQTISKSPKSIQGSEQSPIQSQKPSQHIVQERSSQSIDQQRLPSQLDQNQKFGDSTKKVQQKTVEEKLSTPDQDNKKCIPLPANQHLELASPKGHDQKHSKEISQSKNDDIKSNIATSTDSAVASKFQNAAGQQSSNQSSFNHTNDLRKSFTKRLKRVFSLNNIKQDDVTQLSSSTSNSGSPSPPSASVVKPKFSSLRVRGKNHINNLNDNNKNNNIKQTIKNSNVDKDVSPIKGDIDVEINNNKTGSTSSRRSFIDIQSLFAKNDKKQNKEHKHQRQPSQQEQRQFRTSSSDRCSNQKKRSEDKKRNSKDGNPSEDIKNGDKQKNENKPKRERNSMVLFKKASIPPRFSSLPSRNSRNNNRYKHPTIQLQTQYQPQISNKSDPISQGSLSEDCVNNQHITQSQLNSLPASQSSKTGTPSIGTLERHNVPSYIATIKANKPYLNLNTSASRSVPSLVTGRDNDLPLTPSTLKKLQFSSNILVHETWTPDDYDRRGDQSTCNKLTPLLAQKIKQELNEFKLIEMQVHEDSKKNTHFFA